MSSRKQHNTEAGYRAERTNPFVPGTKVVIYEAEKQGIDTNIVGTENGADRYAIVCDAHGQIGSATSMPKARQAMKFPDVFCTCCRDLAGYR